jgi:hypothetical protein
MHLCFGMAVRGSDDTEAGALECVLIAPDTREITHVVVRSPQVSEDVLLPLSMVQGSTDHGLLLHVASGDLASMPRYYEGRTSAPPAGRVDTSVVPEPAARHGDLEAALAVQSNALELGPETAITTSDGSDGLLVGVLAEQYVNRLSGLCMSGLCERDVVVPDERIGAMYAGAIAIEATCGELPGFAPAPVLAGVGATPSPAEEREESERAERWHAQHTAAE